MPEIPLKPEDQQLLNVQNFAYPDLQTKSKSAEAADEGNQANDLQSAENETLDYPSVQELQAIREQAFSEGFESGYKEGLAKGKKDGLKKGLSEGAEQGLREGKQLGQEQAEKQVQADYQQQLQQAQQAWQSIIKQLHTHISNTEPELKKALMQMVVQICRGIFFKEMQLSPDHIQAIVHKALHAFPLEAENIQLFLNADDHAELEALTQYQTQQSVNSVVDDSLTSGGCIVKSKYSYVDYTLEYRFQSQLQSLIDAIPDLDWQALQSLQNETYSEQSKDVEQDLLTGNIANACSNGSNEHRPLSNQDTSTIQNEEVVDLSAPLSEGHLNWVSDIQQARQQTALLQPLAKG